MCQLGFSKIDALWSLFFRQTEIVYDIRQRKETAMNKRSEIFIVDRGNQNRTKDEAKHTLVRYWHFLFGD